MTPTDVESLTLDQIFLLTCDKKDLRVTTNTMTLGEALKRGLIERPEGYGSVCEQVTAQAAEKGKRDERRQARRERRERRKRNRR